MTRILLISGDTRVGSLHTAALRTAVRAAPADLAVTLYDGLRDLPAYVPGEPALPAAVALLRQRAEAADAVLFSTPEYAGSLPGSLKNLLDWLVDGGDLRDKQAAWLSVTPPAQDQAALATLETVLGHAGARLLRSACIRIPLPPEAVDERGLVADPQLRTALLDMLRALGRTQHAPAQPPSWQVHSSVYPVVPRRDPSVVRPWRMPT
ncbi:hypothetical protein Asp14428_02790 [Actinoplanes sp. NBRC 14428]|uniref:NAD(P)H-dependent FMN reductase n=1 Tax=Pseudosporangium ferrugineum TaxID=439699 RepID=A0A2T0SIH4_9ACTN|nr:NADPH-dependent FMN reductase [Pseudosporangium ferrugineum]PRY33202.1 NAD(P)H-dependent FMN reductase [Pseudosporangium ferrugineum]BCJ48804.1 hypothetical protein Asp14428_02790 [Actinoplanes sp. NBRC 14428]